jgi:hypothetical protein
MGLRAVLKPDSYKDQSKARRAVSNVKSKLQTWGHGEWGLVVPRRGGGPSLSRTYCFLGSDGKVTEQGIKMGKFCVKAAY